MLLFVHVSVWSCAVMDSVPASNPLRSLVVADFPEEVPPPHPLKRHCYQTTNEQREIIINMYVHGKRAKKIAEEVNIPYSAVRAVIRVFRRDNRVYKLPRHVGTSPWTSEHKDALVAWQIRHAEWSYKKLQMRFHEKFPNIRVPGTSTIHRILKTHPPKPFTSKLLYRVPAGMYVCMCMFV